MSKEIDLMLPRYEVIADYPDSTRQVGQIITIDANKTKEWIESHCAFFEKYPHLFKKLAWYEHRDVEDLPKYLNNAIHEVGTGEKEIFKVVKYGHPFYVQDCAIPHWSFYAYPEWNPDEGFPMIYFEPATEQEYNAYNNISNTKNNDDEK